MCGTVISHPKSKFPGFASTTTSDWAQLEHTSFPPMQAEVVEQLGRRIQFLESRLAQSQAYASMPAGMRPSLVDSSVDAASVGKPASSLKICRRTTQEAVRGP